MDDFEISTPVYLVDGILESGKTSFLNFTIRQDYFQVDGTTLLISCEEGEEEYDEKDLLKYHTVLETIEEPEDLTLSTLRAFEKKYRPERVIIEYNPLWGVNKLRAMEMPPGWGICQEIVIIDGGSYEIYPNNMQSVFTEMVQDADMVIFKTNRCKISSDIIANIDMNNPKKYVEGKTVRLKPEEYFVPGRKAMTCCRNPVISDIKTPLAKNAPPWRTRTATSSIFSRRACLTI